MISILIVEDYEPLVRLYEKEFGREGYRVVSAKSLKEALCCYPNLYFDVAVIEIECIRRKWFGILINNLTHGKKVPIVINTSGQACGKGFWDKYVDAWVTKSSDLGPLKECIRNLLP